jgi:phosphohistidine phosphatase SixA
MRGHNPGLQQLALVLASAGDELERLEAKFPTAALATLEAPLSLRVSTSAQSGSRTPCTYAPMPGQRNG